MRGSGRRVIRCLDAELHFPRFTGEQPASLICANRPELLRSAIAASAERSVHRAMAQEIEFVVKSPSRQSQDDFRLKVAASATVRDVKLKLQAGYPGNPDPATITVSRRAGQTGRCAAQLRALLMPLAARPALLPLSSARRGVTLMLAPGPCSCAGHLCGAGVEGR